MQRNHTIVACGYASPELHIAAASGQSKTVM
jgi:ankyrin repeat protein